MKEKLQLAALILITALAILATVILNHGKIDCNDPKVWGTESGVRYCAIGGGE